MSVVIDAALAHLIKSEEIIRRGRSEFNPETVYVLCNTLVWDFSIALE